jgi:hypothetical protein
MLEAADVFAGERASAVIEAAIADAQTALEARLQRLRVLAELNASVAQGEIGAAQSTRDQTVAALARARPRLDAVRMAVSTDFLALR